MNPAEPSIRPAPPARCTWLLAVLAWLAACGEASAPDGAQPRHAWIHPPPERDPKAVVLPRWLVHPVAPAALAEARAALASEPYIQMSPAMAEHYIGRALRLPAELRPFLVRAVARRGAVIDAVQFDTGLWMRASGGEPATLAARPQVVLLDPTPRDVYVTVGSDSAAASDVE